MALRDPEKQISLGICIPCWNLGWVENTDTKLRFSEPHPAVYSGLQGSPTPNSTPCKDVRA